MTVPTDEDAGDGAEGDPPRPPADPEQEQLDRVRIRQLSVGAQQGEVRTARPAERLDMLRTTDLAQDIELKRRYAYGTLLGLGLQIAVVDVAFFWYLVKSGKELNPVVMDFWLSSTVIEVIGVILVIAKYLFPPRSKDDS